MFKSKDSRYSIPKWIGALGVFGKATLPFASKYDHAYLTENRFFRGGLIDREVDVTVTFYLRRLSLGCGSWPLFWWGKLRLTEINMSPRINGLLSIHIFLQITKAEYLTPWHFISVVHSSHWLHSWLPLSGFTLNSSLHLLEESLHKRLTTDRRAVCEIPCPTS